MQKLLLSACVALAVVATALPLVAAPPAPSQDTTGRTDQPSMTNPSSSQSMTNPSSSQTTAQSAANVRASKVVGTTVNDAQGESLGEIEDLAVCPKTGKVTHAVVGAGGILGMGETKHVVPWQAFRVSLHAPAGTQPDQTTAAGRLEKPQITLNVSKDRLQNAPKFEKADWAKFENEQWVKQIDSYYNVTSTDTDDATQSGQSGSTQPYGSTQQSGSTTQSRSTQQSGTMAQSGQTGSTAQSGKVTVQKASELVGMNVRNNSGNEIGECEDIVFNSKTGRIQYVALSFDELGTGDKYYALPFNSVAFSHEANDPNNRFILCNVSQTELARHQGFSENDWPRTASEGWETIRR